MERYNAKILWVDLSTEEITVWEMGEELTRKFVGGSGLAIKILWDKTKPGTDALSPENLLIFMTGPLTGNVRTSSRYIVASISPLTGIYGEAHSGGDWAIEFKRTGYDGIVFTGKANKPVYLWLRDGKAEIRDAAHIWGKDTYETEELLKKEMDVKASVACIGPAGEKLVRIACVMNEGRFGRAAARCGLGAVMGSKSLKAVVVRGNLPIKVFDKEGLNAYTDKLYATVKIPTWKQTSEMAVQAFTGTMRGGGAPVKNWREGDFADGYKLARGVLACTPYYCRGCPTTDIEGGITANGERHMVWEYWTPFGTNTLISDAEELQEGYSFCNRYGMDTISAGGVIGFAMECYEKGLITDKDTEGIKLNWGNGKAMNKMLKKIGDKEGFGEILGEGVKRAAERIGGLAYEYAMHVKGLELPAHDPRASNGMALEYATGSIGATHIEGHRIENYPAIEQNIEEATRHLPKMYRDMGFSRMMDRFETERKGEMTVKGQHYGTMVNSLVVCTFAMGFMRSTENGISTLADLLNYTCGWDMDAEEYMRVGERIFNLKRMFAVKRGISRKDDTLPPRMLMHKRGSGGTAEHLPPLGSMLSEYYEWRGWSEEGIPTREKLKELGLNECLE